MARMKHALPAVLLAAMLMGGCAAQPPAAPAAASQPAAAATAIPTSAPPTAAPPTTAPTAAPPAPAVANAAFTITGKVDRQMGWTEEQVRAMPTVKAQGKNQQGATETYSGVAINELLQQAGPQAGATTLVFTAGNSTAEATLSAVRACADCILSFRSRGGFSLVLPGFEAGVQLRGVTAVEVK